MKYHKRKSIGSGEPDELLREWVRESLSQPRVPSRVAQLKRAGQYYIATISHRGTPVRGVGYTRESAIARARLMAGRI